MAIEVVRQGFEAENLVGMRETQVLLRAEALVPGAGREAIEPLMADASLFIDAADLQADRIVLDGEAMCQAVYRQGDEPTLRALGARASLSQVLEIPGAEAGMFTRVSGVVEHVEARYENGHMIFLVTCALRAQVLRLQPVTCVTGLSGRPGLETDYGTLQSVKLAAESSEMALLRETAALPAELDARATLMDWATVEIESAVPDLGGVRVQGRILVETLVSSGTPGRPAAVVRVPMALNQLVELPEWLVGDVAAEADLRGVRTQIGMAADGESPQLNCEAEVRVRVLANATDAPVALRDIYATQGSALEVKRQAVSVCREVLRARSTEPVRGAVPAGDGAEVGEVLAVRANPVIADRRAEGGKGRVEGVLELNALCLASEGSRPMSVQAEMPFAIGVTVPLDEAASVQVQVLSVEAAALMGGRLDVKAQIFVSCESRVRETVDIVSEVEEGAPIVRQPGIVIVWPAEGDTAWTLGRRYAIPAARAEGIAPGKPLVLKV